MSFNFDFNSICNNFMPSFNLPAVNFDMNSMMPNWNLSTDFLLNSVMPLNNNFMNFDMYMPQFSSSSSKSTSDTFSYKGPSDLKPGLFKGTLAGKEALVTSICKKYNVDTGLVAAIIGLESGYGTSAKAKNNNFMGYRAAGDLGKDSRGFGIFSSAEKGLEKAIKNLARYTRYSDVHKVDFNNLNAIGRHYCEGGVWANGVRSVYSSRVKSYLA